MPRDLGKRRARWGGAALLILGLVSPARTAVQDGRQTVQVGQVTAIANPGDLALAIALAERADQPASWLALGTRTVAPLTLIVVRGADAFSGASRGRVPAWGAGMAVAAARVVVVRVDGDDPFRVLRHELAHLALHQAIRGRVPLWFAEGYAVQAAQELGRLDQLRLNLAVALGQVPTLDLLDAGLRSSQSTAEASYALAGTAVAFLSSRTRSRTLEPLIEHLRQGEPFDSAVARSTGFAPGQFEAAWRKSVKRTYGVGLWLSAGGMWVVVAALVVLAWVLRRRRDLPRKAALDEGWVVDESGDPDGSPPPGPPDDSAPKA